MLKKYHIFIITVLIFYSNSIGQSLKSVTKEQLIEFSKSFSQPDDALGFTADEKLPSDFNLKFLSPPIVRQEGGSCVGHSIATSLSIKFNAVNEYYEWGRSYTHKFDPYFIYTALKENNIECGIGCECGAYIWEGFELLVDHGVKKQFVSPDLKCRDNLNNKLLLHLANKTSKYTIDDFYAIISYDDNGNKKTWELNKIKEWVYYGYAPVVGIDIGDDFDNVSNNGRYRLPKKMHYSDGELGGHAVTLIGWDDNKDGGSFLFQNSWGRKWGDNGFFWLSYRDFYNEVDRGFVMYKEDFSDWKESYRSGSYYKGDVYDNGKPQEGYYYEGGINQKTNLFHGEGILDTPNATAAGAYQNGHKHGWWFVCYDNYNSDGSLVQDPFFGKILFDKGEIIEKESFGFTIGSENSNKAFDKRMRFDIYDIPELDEPATIDDFIQSDLDFFQKKLSAIE